MKSFPKYQDVATALGNLSDEAAIHLWWLYFRRSRSVAYHEQIFLRAGSWVARAAASSTEQRRRQLFLNAIEDRMYELRPTLEGWSPFFLSLMAVRLSEEYERGGVKTKIDDAIHAQQRAMNAATKGHWRPPVRSVLWAMFGRFEEYVLSDNVERATNIGDETQLANLTNLGNMLSNRFECTGSIEDLDRAVNLYTEAYQAVSEDPVHAFISNNLGSLLSSRFEHMGSMEDVNRAIDLANEALKAHPRRCLVLNTLGRGLVKRAEHAGSMTDLNSAIETFNEALKGLHADDPLGRGILSNLQFCLDLRFIRTGLMADLNSAIDMGYEALRTCSNDHSRAIRLNLLGKSLRNRSERTGSMEDLDKSIQLWSEALSLTSTSPIRIAPLNNLGQSLFDRYQRTKSVEDLELSIALTDEALQIGPSDQHNRPGILNNLASGLSSRFKENGSVDDLIRAVEVLSEALKLLPLNHPGRVSKLSFLGALLVLRYQRNGSREDLDRAIKVAKEAMDATPTHHPDRISLLRETKYVLSYQSARDGNVEAINRIVEVNDEALELLPLDHPDRVRWLTDLGVALEHRFSQFGSADDIDRAVRSVQEAIEATPADDVARNERLGMLGTWLSRRYQCTGSITDSDRAIEIAHQVLKSTALNHPSRIGALNNLAHILISRYERTKSVSDIEPFLSALKEGWESNTAPPTQRIHAAEATVYLLDLTSDWDESSVLMEKAVQLLPRVSPRLLKHADKEHELKIHNGLASRATAYALRAGKKPYDVLKILELGRGIIASFLLDLRGDISTVEQHSPGLAAEFITLRDELDTPTNKSDSWDPSSALSIELEEAKRRETDKRLNEVIGKIRAQPGLSNFLLPPTEDDLKAAAQSGPIIVINVDDFRCDAILIERHQITSLNLPDLTLEDVEEHVRTLQASRHVSSSQTASTLEWLWDTVAGPCLDALGYRSPITDDNWPHVWWIPTGPLSHLPLHAAGQHVNGSANTVLDRVVSSYSSSAKALLRGRRCDPQRAQSSTPLNALLVVMQDTPAQLGLQFAVDEVSLVESLCPSLQFSSIRPPQPIREEILNHMKTSSIFHFAGHGISNPSQPSESCLLLKDWQTNPLTMSHLRDLHLQDPTPPFLAYLSACSTGANEAKDLDDEGINLISACQLAGFRHVIGTLWEVSDRYCVDVAKIVYETLRDEGLTDAAVARGLHRATRVLRDVSASKTSRQRRSSDCGEAQLTYGADEGSSDTWEKKRDGTLLISSAKRPRKPALDPFWIPYMHYGV